MLAEWGLWYVNLVILLADKAECASGNILSACFYSRSQMTIFYLNSAHQRQFRIEQNVLHRGVHVIHRHSLLQNVN